MDPDPILDRLAFACAERVVLSRPIYQIDFRVSRRLQKTEKVKFFGDRDISPQQRVSSPRGYVKRSVGELESAVMLVGLFAPFP